MKKVAVTCGDPAGVGLDVLSLWIQENPAKLSRIEVGAPYAWVERFPGVEVVPMGPSSYQPTSGHPDETGAKIAWASLEWAAQASIEGETGAVVTCPIHKAKMQAIGFRWPGHTEFFAEKWVGDPVMAFAGTELRVALATWHIPLSQVIATLKAQPELIYRAVEALRSYLRTEGLEHPRIALCGLNPHAGEEGLLGDDESTWLKPIVDKLQKEDSAVTGPYPPDTVFWRARKGEFDGVVALYHDQGLIAVKTLEMDQAVNMTLGLNFLRTSPDHGTAFDLAGRGLADATSFSRAMKIALQSLSG